jgi:CubicO group peptidase (beta-lactamase class C family)
MKGLGVRDVVAEGAGSDGNGSTPADDAARSGRRVSRRTVLHGAVAAGIASGVAAAFPRVAHARVPGVAPEWEQFDSAVRAAFRRLGMVGASVAVVSAEDVLYTSTHGVRDRTTWKPVTNDTHFLVASTTKSMSSLLVATYVDEGLFGWDQLVIDAWSGFRAPTDELTKTLKIRDLLGMASGIDEPPALSGMHEGVPTAAQLLQSVVNLPVSYPPNQNFYYNNTVYAVGGYLPALAQGVALEDLEATYIQQMGDRVFGPAGMATATIADDPRGVVPQYAVGYGPDLRGRSRVLPYGPVGSYAPVGGTLASLVDMAAYVRLQLRQGTSITGATVVSAANLAECHKRHIDTQWSPNLDPDVTASGYAMGWINQTYKDGTSLVWHNGGIDGFTTFIGFLPERDLGLVVLNSMNPSNVGTLFYTAVLDALISERFGLNVGVGEKVDSLYDQTMSALRDSWDQSRPGDRATVAPFLGQYQNGYRLAFAGNELQVTNGARVMPVRAMPDGSYVMSGGLLLGAQVQLTRGPDGSARMDLVGIERVQRTVGLD